VFQFTYMIKTVSTYTTSTEAYIAKGRLQAEGIPAYIADEYYISAQWTISQALGGVRLQVPTSLESQALKVIREIEQGSYQVPLTRKLKESESTYCPKCNSANTYQVNWVWKISFVLMFMNILPLPFSRHRFKCSNCAKSWIASENRSYSVALQVFASILIATVIIAIFFFLYYWRCKYAHCLYFSN